MKKLLSYLTGMVLLAVTLPGSLYADRVDFLVNDDGSVAQQTHPRIAVAGDGSFVIVWSDKRNGGTDIFLQRYDSDGFPVSANRQVNDDMVAAHQAEPAIAADLSGLYSLVWTDYRNGTYPFDPDVFFQRYDSAVTPVGVNRNLTTELPDSLKETPDIALSPWGGGMVVWADYRNRNWDIYGQLISSDGSTIGANFRVNNDVGSSQQHAPRVAVSPEGWYAVTWYDNRNGHDDIYAQLYDSLANTIAVNVRVNSDGGSARQAFPDVATDGAGHFSVVWVDWRNGTYPSNPDIFARKFNTALVPMTSDKRLNTDGTFRAQREPSIAADRRGNLAMIWADSTGGSSSWDIVGQMMDFDGVIREANFRANSHADSAQLQPDVAVDGRYRYITWVDKRNGNFDIYASITKYNDPTLIPAPQSLKYEMLVGESVPAAQTVVVEHAGYNPLSFSTSLSHDWLAIAPTSGTTPDTVSVSIATDTLAFGTYFGEVKLIDNATGDSSVVISVRLDVTAPILELSADTVVIPVFAGVDDSVAATVDITNGGGGVLNWNLAESADWLSLSTTSGTNDSTVTLWANAVDLLAGNHATPLEVDAGEVMNSPDTLWVIAEVVSNMPYLLIEPKRIRLVTNSPVGVDTSVAVSNAGVGIINWTAVVSAPWLQADVLEAVGAATVGLTIDTTGLLPGEYSADIVFTDSGSFNVTDTLEFVLEYWEASDDTVVVGSETIGYSQSGTVPIEFRLTQAITGAQVPLAYDPDVIHMDSVVLGADAPGFLAASCVVDSGRGLIRISLAAGESDSSVSIGLSELVVLHVSARGAPGFTTLAMPVGDSVAATVTAPSGDKYFTTVLAGDVLVDNTTDIADHGPDLLPEHLELSQNHPNPFNAGTLIRFSLPAVSEITLRLYNVLGQNVRTLTSGTRSAGEHAVFWDGLTSSGRPAASGIYFYRLETSLGSRVRKMVLLK